jgi:hypothetical protein
MIQPIEKNTIFDYQKFGFMKYEIFSIDKKVGLLNLNQEVVLPAEYDNITFDFQEQYALIKRDGKWGMFGKDGNILCECIYDSVHLDFVGSNYACVANYSESGKLLYGLINKKGELIIDCLYHYIDSTPIDDKFIVGQLSECDTKHQSKILYGLINGKGKSALPCLYESKEQVVEAVGKGWAKKE